jgi:hypothetical protein
MQLKKGDSEVMHAKLTAINNLSFSPITRDKIKLPFKYQYLFQELTRFNQKVRG